MLRSGFEPCMVESSLDDIVDESGSSGKGEKTLCGATEKAWGLVNWNNYDALWRHQMVWQRNEDIIVKNRLYNLTLYGYSEKVDNSA